MFFENLEMYLGERRFIGLSITSAKGDAFNVISATYVLEDPAGHVEDSGNCTITSVSGSEKRLDLYVEPTKVGTYNLIYTYNIANETLKNVVNLFVCEA